jgi:hypothetical protein
MNNYPTVQNPLVLAIEERVPAMKNRKQLVNTKAGKPALINNPEIKTFINKHKFQLRRAVNEQGFDVVPLGQTVAMWCHFCSKASDNGNPPTFDIDGAVTTICEMFQPKSVSEQTSIGAPVYEDDRQVRPSHQSEIFVKSKKFERVEIFIWVIAPEGDFLLDLMTLRDYNVHKPANHIYDDLDDLLEELL